MEEQPQEERRWPWWHRHTWRYLIFENAGGIPWVIGEYCRCGQTRGVVDQLRELHEIAPWNMTYPVMEEQERRRRERAESASRIQQDLAVDLAMGRTEAPTQVRPATDR